MEPPVAAETNDLWTRLAPSPTGALHLGNIRTFVINWVLARQNGWKILLRIDDLDGPRKKPGAVEQALDILEWIGLDWDRGPIFQSRQMELYHEAFASLARQGLVYPCACSRKEIEQASVSAPHAGELRYPGTCRLRQLGPPDQIWNEASQTGCRIRIPDETIEFRDHVAGAQAHNVQREVGDFLIRTRGGDPSYQFSVVIDDQHARIRHVVRGDDLLGSTARQLWIYRLLGFAAPEYWHLPLVVGTDGRRLAKRHGDTRVTTLREQGISPHRLLGWIGNCSGVPNPGDLSINEFADQFEIDRLPRTTVVWDGEL